MATFEITSMVTITIMLGLGESLLCEREPINFNDRYAVSVVKDDIIIARASS